MSPVLPLIAVGGLLVLLGVGWRIVTTRRIRQRLLSLLGAADPATRAGTLRIVAAEGIEGFAKDLLRMSETETDPTVLAVLSGVVNRTQAMPARSPDLISLRLWAAARGIRDSVSAAAVSGSTASASRFKSVPSERAVIDERSLMNGSTGRRRVLAAGKSQSGDPAEPQTFMPPEVDSVPERPTSPVVLVTGAGGPAGVAVIRALSRVGHRVIAADADSYAVGFRLADEFARVPRADDPAFAESLLKVAARSGAVALIPTVAEELRPLHAAAGRLGDAGIATWLPHPWSVEHCVDKWLFYQLMIKHGVSVPATSGSSDRGIPGPWIVKPRFGRGSRDVYEVHDRADLAYAMGHAPEPLVQTKITGREFTVDTLSGDDGRLYGAVPRWRLETKAGISTKGLTFDHTELLEQVAELLAVLRLAGPGCVQGFLTEDGEVAFTEVNPRFSGGLPLSLAAGADLVGQYLNRILGGAVEPERLRFRPGVTMLRYFDEVFEE